MLKKIFGSAVAAGLLAASSVAASAAPVAFERAGSPVGAAEELNGGSELLLIAAFGALAVAIIALIEASENDPDLPVSP